MTASTIQLHCLITTAKVANAKAANAPITFKGNVTVMINEDKHLLLSDIITLLQGTSGTALHEAALYGKVDVVNLLLQCGKLISSKAEILMTIKF